MEGLIVLFGLILIVVVLGAICGFVAFSRTQGLVRELEDAKRQLRSLRDEIKKHEGPPIPEKKVIAPLQPVPARAVEPSIVTRVQKVMEAPSPPIPQTLPPKMKQEIPPSQPPKFPSQSLEMKLGTKWLNWVGIVMLLVGIGFFLKYAYDNAWIGPKGRLAIGVILGNHRDWSWRAIPAQGLARSVSGSFGRRPGYFLPLCVLLFSGLWSGRPNPFNGIGDSCDGPRCGDGRWL